MATSGVTEQRSDLARLLRVLGHPARLEIVRLTSQREVGVGEVASAIGLSQPLTSQHLRVLREHDIVDVRRRGNQRLYRTNEARAGEIRSRLDELWPDSLERLKAAAERRHLGNDDR